MAPADANRFLCPWSPSLYVCSTSCQRVLLPRVALAKRSFAYTLVLHYWCERICWCDRFGIRLPVASSVPVYFRSDDCFLKLSEYSLTCLTVSWVSWRSVCVIHVPASLNWLCGFIRKSAIYTCAALPGRYLRRKEQFSRLLKVFDSRAQIGRFFFFDYRSCYQRLHLGSVTDMRSSAWNSLYRLV